MVLYNDQTTLTDAANEVGVYILRIYRLNREVLTKTTKETQNDKGNTILQSKDKTTKHTLTYKVNTETQRKHKNS
jgi:hypothetical protein